METPRPPIKNLSPLLLQLHSDLGGWDNEASRATSQPNVNAEASCVGMPFEVFPICPFLAQFMGGKLCKGRAGLVICKAELLTFSLSPRHSFVQTVQQRQSSYSRPRSLYQKKQTDSHSVFPSPFQKKRQGVFSYTFERFFVSGSS